jgi:hypothetical protein
MSQPTTNIARVVNLGHEEYDVLIARPSKWENPFQIGRDGSREQVIKMYEVHIRRRPDLLAALPELAGKRLGCHGDVLVKLLAEFGLYGETPREIHESRTSPCDLRQHFDIRKSTNDQQAN